MDSWHSYPKVYNIGHAGIADIFKDPVIIEEKIDGSQFSFGKFFDPSQEKEVLRVRSKGCEMLADAPEKMFSKAVDTAKSLFDKIISGWTYRCEFLHSPKHNTLCYERVPDDHLIIFDINTGMEKYLNYNEKQNEASRLGLETVPLIHSGTVQSIEVFRGFLETVSVLGGQKVEGVVAKNYERFGKDGKALMGKFVSESFKETHASDWKERNPLQGDVLEKLVYKYKTPARWAKALQHLKEAGKIEDSPRDIGLLIKEIPHDVLVECGEEIKEDLFKWVWPNLSRRLCHGMPEWYKEELLKKQFN